MSGGFIAGNNRPSDPSAPGFSGQYNDLTGKPAIPTAASLVLALAATFVENRRVEGEVTESEINIPTSGAVAGVITDLAAALHNINTQTGLPAILSQWGGHLNRTTLGKALVSYNPTNLTTTDINGDNLTLTAANGFGSVAMPTTNLDQGNDLLLVGGYYFEAPGADMSAGTAFSLSMPNPGIGAVRVRTAANGTDNDKWIIGMVGNQLGTTRTIPADSTTLPARHQYVNLADGALNGVIPHTEETDDSVNYVAQTIVFPMPDNWTIGEEITIEIGLGRNGNDQGTGNRNDIFIAERDTDQDTYIGGYDSRFNITIGGTTFEGLFDWSYRGSDHSLLVHYTPEGHRETLTTDWTVRLFFQAAASTTAVAEHLAFVPFTTQPAVDDSLNLTLHYVTGTTWQIIATSGQGLILEQSSVDVGKFDAADILYFKQATTYYQRISFGAAGVDLPLTTLTALHNHSAELGYGLFVFNDKTVFATDNGAVITGDSIDGGVGQNWKFLGDSNWGNLSYAAGTNEYAILASPSTQALRVQLPGDGSTLIFAKVSGVVGSYQGHFSSTLLSIVTSDISSVMTPLVGVGIVEYLIGTAESK